MGGDTNYRIPCLFSSNTYTHVWISCGNILLSTLYDPIYIIRIWMKLFNLITFLLLLIFKMRYFFQYVVYKYYLNHIIYFELFLVNMLGCLYKYTERLRSYYLPRAERWYGGCFFYTFLGIYGIMLTNAVETINMYVIMNLPISLRQKNYCSI